MPPADDRFSRRRLLDAAVAAAWPALFLSAMPAPDRRRAAASGAEIVASVATGATVPADPLRQFGVSLAGAEFGVESAPFCAANPGVCGVDYFHPTPGGPFAMWPPRACGWCGCRCGGSACNRSPAAR